MSNSIYNSKYAQTIDVNPMSLYTPASIFSSNTLLPAYSDMYIPSRSFDNRNQDKYRQPTHMWTSNKKIAMFGAAAYAVLGVLTRGRSIQATGKLLLRIGKSAGSVLARAGTAIGRFVRNHFT